MPMWPSSRRRRIVRSERTTRRFYGRALGYRGFVAATRTIELRTEVPGPRSREILARKQRVVADALTVSLPVVIEEARGATFTDVDGYTLLDFSGGIGSIAVGHFHLLVVSALEDQ